MSPPLLPLVILSALDPTPHFWVDPVKTTVGEVWGGPGLTLEPNPSLHPPPAPGTARAAA
jgi:hypothetical protein